MKKLLTISSILLGLFLFTGIASASTTDVLQPASTITYNEDLTVNGTGRFSSIYIGETGVGGVTFFNGTIINIGEYDPVTFGDDVRIDGQIWGGPHKGNAADQGLKIADTLLPGLTNLNDIGSSSLRWKDLYLSGTLHGVGANYSGDVQVGNLLGAGVVSSNNILDDTIQGKDIKNQTLQGQHISTSADLNISQLYAVDGIITNGTLTVTENASFSKKVIVGTTLEATDAEINGGFGDEGITLRKDGAIALDGDIMQKQSAYGSVKALAAISGSAGGCVPAPNSYWSSKSGTISCDRVNKGEYKITFPNFNFVAGDLGYFNIMPISASSADIANFASHFDSDTVIIKYYKESAGSYDLDDGIFYIFLY